MSGKSRQQEILDHYLDVEERESRKIQKGTFWVLLSRMRKYRALLLFGIVLMLVSTLFLVAEPRIFGFAVDSAIVPKNWELLKWVGVAFLVIEIARFAAMTGYTYLFSVLGQKLMQDFRVELFEHLHRIPITVYDKNPAGRLVTRVTNDIATLGEMFSSGFVTIVGNGVVIVGTVVAMLLLDWKLALAMISILPALIAISARFSVELKNSYRDARSKLSALNAFLAENIQGMRTVQVFGRERGHLDRFETINRWYTDAQVRSVDIFAVFHPSITVFSGISMGIVLGYGGWRVAHGTLPLGSLVAFFGYALAIFHPMRELADKWNIFLSGMTSAERIFSILSWEKEPNVPEVRSRVDRGLKLRGEVVFENVSFAYEGTQWVIKDFSAVIRAGSKVGVVGHTGAGKSTLISLLLRFYEPQKGRILIDGKDIREYDKRELRAAIGIVQQDVFLFSGNVRENIRLWDASLDVEACARKSGLEEGVSRLESGFDTRLQERGANLSTGEKQIVAFLRAAVRNPSIWVLDEATANVDSISEKAVQDAMESLSQGRTSLVVAHRLATIQDADMILVLHRGALVESGTHSELIRSDGLYRRLYEFQMAGGSEALSSQSV